MTSDDQFFFDYLASIPHDVRRYSLEVADSIDRHVDHVAGIVRDTLSQQTWLPSSVRPSPRTQGFVQPVPLTQTFTDRVRSWVLHNRAWTAAIFAFVGTSCILFYGNKKLNGKRRKARRAANGARKEIVVIAGSPHEAITRSIAFDLERRGYIVYITVSSAEEEQIVQSENRMDIRALWLDLSMVPPSPSEIHPSLREIHSLMTQNQFPIPGVPPHNCQLSGLILLPSPNYATGPVATILPSTWADTVNTRLLSPIITTQLFFPLLTLRSANSTVLLVYPSISSSLSAPFASPEVTTARALAGFAASLRRELRLSEQGNVDIVEMRLGNIDFGPHFGNQQSQVSGTEVLSWTPQQRTLYGSHYLSSIGQRQVASSGPKAIRGSPARSLHYAVLAALEPPSKTIFGNNKAKKPVIYVGRGSRSYTIIGEWLPEGLVGWMLGLRSGPKASPDSFSGNGSETSWEKI